MIHAVPKPTFTKRAPKGLGRGKPMRQRGKKGAAFAKVRNREARAFVRSHACLLRGRLTKMRMTINDMPLELAGGLFRHRCWGPVDPAHVNDTQARGAADLGECAPLCRAAHRVLDRIKKVRFERATQLDLSNIAAGLALKFVERGGRVENDIDD